MKARWISFGEIEIDGRRYGHDIVIQAGAVEKRHKKASKAYREETGHTPLSTDERIPWGGERLIVGTGQYGSMPVLPAVWTEAERRGVEVIALPSEEALGLIREADARDVYAIIHVTC